MALVYTYCLEVLVYVSEDTYGTQDEHVTAWKKQ